MKTLVAGIGSMILGDDGVGVQAAGRLKVCFSFDQVDIIELGTAGLGLLDFIEGYDRLIILDAIVTGAPPGTIYDLKGEDVTRTVHLGAGHEADLPTTLALGRNLLGAHMPEDIVVVAVEAGNITTFSECLTPEVEAAIPMVLARVKGLLEERES